MHFKFGLLGLSILGVTDVAWAQLQIATEPPPEATMVARTDAGGAAAMPLVQERLEVLIDRQFARTEIKQTYHNRSGATVEGQYRLRAGGGARVEGFAYWNGEQKIVGEVFEKATARAVYEEVTSRRRDPGLLEKVSDGVFAFRIFPIQPEEKKRVSITYASWLRRRGNRVEYRAPVNLASADVKITIRSSRQLREIRSSSHEIDADVQQNGDVTVRVRAARRDRGQLVLSWQVAEPPWSLAAFVHKDAGSDGYFALSLAAPEVNERSVAAKDVTIVIDRSGSMHGTPIEQARTAAIGVVERLGPTDRLNVIAFDDEVDPLFEEPRAANRQTRERAIAYISRLAEGGGTDIALALRTALAAQHEGRRPRVILFVTDGQSSAPEALQAVDADKRDARIFTVGVGEGVNQPLLARLAAAKRGRFTFIRDPNDLERDVSTLYRQISRPLLVDVSLDVDGASPHRVYPRSLPDLFVEDELLISGRLTGTGPTQFILRGTLDGKPVAYRARVDVQNGTRRPWVGKLWAQSRVDHLSEKIALGEGGQEHQREVVELALLYNFVTDFTSFLAIPESELTGSAKDAIAAARAQKQELYAEHADAAQLGAAPMAADAEMDAMGASSGESMEVRRKSGCAGCAAGGSGGGLPLALALAFLLVRRRRRG